MPPTARHLPARLAFGPALRMQSDGRLVDLVREGHDSAFEEIVRRYRRPLDRLAASIVGTGADDVTQDSFRKALEALRRAEVGVELRPWLFRIVRNTALNDLRDRPPAAAELAEELVAGGRSAAADAEQRAELQDLTAQLRALPENQRAALVMRELEGMSHEEIAAALGISDGAARQAIARARATIRSGFGALIPLPLLRALAGGADGIAGSGSAAGGAAIAAGAGGIGAGALKVGLATVVVAGTIGAGVAIEQHGGGHAPGEPRSVAAAPGAGAPSTAPAPLHHSPRIESSDRSSTADRGTGGDGQSSDRRRHHRSKGSGAAGQGPRLVPVAQQTTVAAPEPTGHSDAGGGPGPGRNAGGHDGGDEGGGGGHDTGGGNHGQSQDGGAHRGPEGGGDQGSTAGDGGSAGGEDSGHEASGDRTSGSSSGDDGHDGSADGGAVPAAVQPADPSDDGTPSSGGDAGSSGSDGVDSGGEAGATPESALPSTHEPLAEGVSEPSP